MATNARSHSSAGHRQRLRNRFEKAGRIALADYELLELLLTYIIPRVDTKPMAKALLHRFDNIIGVLQQPDEQLTEIQGIGPKTATFFRVIQACLVRCTESVVEQNPSITGPKDIFSFVRLYLRQRNTECVYALYLNDGRRIVHHAEVTTGTVDRVAVYPREILKPALINDATGIILVHNHPEGQAIPSEKDLKITQDLKQAAALFDIKLIDHMVITRLQAFSIKTGKLL